MEKQVAKSHYEFDRYVSKSRWASMWHQLDEVLSLQPDSVLEVGPGPGIFQSAAKQFGVSVETLDLDPELQPDYVAAADEMPFADDRYDVVCAFQMLEHVPYEDALRIAQEMSRVAARHIVISLPDSLTVWRYSLHIPKRGQYKRLLPRPGFRPKPHEFDGQHYWEINKADFPLSSVKSDLAAAVKVDEQGVRTYRVFENPYHRFFVINL